MYIFWELVKFKYKNFFKCKKRLNIDENMFSFIQQENRVPFYNWRKMQQDANYLNITSPTIDINPANNALERGYVRWFRQ